MALNTPGSYDPFIETKKIISPTGDIVYQRDRFYKVKSYVGMIAPKNLGAKIVSYKICEFTNCTVGEKAFFGTLGYPKMFPIHQVSVLCAALYPNIVQILSPELKYKQTAAGAMLAPPTADELKFKTKADGYVNIHPSSVNAKVAVYEVSWTIVAVSVQ